MDPVIHFFMHTNPLLFYVVVAVVLLLESSGVPTTNNALLVFAGALASLGHLNIWNLALAAIVGSICGACLAYEIGVRGGRQIVVRAASWFHIDEQKIDMAEGWFQKSGMWMIFFSRMTPFIRPFACFPAGISQMNIVRFFIAASTGSIVWCVAMLSIGWTLGRRWKLALLFMSQYTVPTICVLVLLVVFYCLITYAMKCYIHSRI